MPALPTPRLRAALLLLALLTGCRQAPTTQRELAERMLARFEDNVGDASGFTVVLGGYELRYTLSPDTSAAERFNVAIATTGEASDDPLVQAMATSYLPNVPLLAVTLADTPLGAPAARGGTEVYAVDASGVADTTDMSAGLMVYVDAETFQVREVERTIRIDSLARPISSRLFYDDYRAVDGVTLPHRVRVRQDGLEQLLSQPMRVQEGGRLTLQREQLRGMPPSPSRAQMLEGVERRLRAITEGVEEAEATVARVTVQRPR